MPLESKAFTIEVPVLITSLSPMKAFYTPEIFSVHLNNHDFEIGKQLTVQKFKTRIESLRLFDQLESSGDQTTFVSYTMPKIERAIGAFISIDETFLGPIDIGETQTMFGEPSVSYEMISCEFLITDSMEPYLIECETDPRATHDLRQSEVIYDEMIYIVLAEYANEEFEHTLRYWKAI